MPDAPVTTLLLPSRILIFLYAILELSVQYGL